MSKKRGPNSPMESEKNKQKGQSASTSAAAAAPQAQRAAASMTMIVNRQKTTIQSIINSPIVSCGCGH